MSISFFWKCRLVENFALSLTFNAEYHEILNTGMHVFPLLSKIRAIRINQVYG